MEKRVILAIALSILIVLLFQYIAPKPSNPPPITKMGKETSRLPLTKETDTAAYKPSKFLAEEKHLEIQTDKYILTFSNVGGSIKKILLKDYKEHDSNEPLELVQIKNPEDYIFNIYTQPDTLSLNSSLYDLEKKDDVIIYSTQADGLEIKKKYILHNYRHSIELQLFIKNISGAPKEFNYNIIGGAGVKEIHEQDKRFVEVTTKINGKILGFNRPKGARIINLGTVSWTALKNKYFSIILKPFVNTRNQFYGLNEDGYLVMGVGTEAVTIEPNSLIENRFILYAGPSQISTLKEFGYEVEESVNYGFFGGISKILISCLRLFYTIVHSWGISIILLSIFLNIILFPLTIKSFRSMQKMQELHPQMEKLKSQYKDNPQKLNKEIMELYKKYNINPFSGCLPMLLQMPIFIALYQALMKSIELRSTKFLWIKDLSSPDAVRIPLSLPIIGSNINILPIVMVIAMVIQQKISTKSMGGAVTEEQKQQQKMMLILMPIMFGFIFYNMPSGLVFYWVVNTVLTIVEQAAILKKA